MNSAQQFADPAVEKFGDDLSLVVGTSLWKDAWRRLLRNRMALFGGIAVTVLVLSCLIGPILMEKGYGYDYETQNLEYGAQPPSAEHWFGTDFFGRDLFTRILYGGRVSLAVGLLAAFVSATIGTIYGATSGYLGGRIDSFMMRIVDILYTMPYMFLVIILVTIFGRSIIFVFLCLGLVGWLTTARIVRGQVLSLKEKEFVDAAINVGATGFDIVFRHLIPNTLGPIVVYFTLTVPSMMLQEAFLSFLGLGVQEPQPSLGSLISEGACLLYTSPSPRDATLSRMPSSA